MLDCREVRDFNCDECYELSVENCEDITVQSGLTPDTSYYLNVFDQFDIKRTIQIETEDDGSFTIDQSLLPDSYFNPFGNYDFNISSDEEGEIIIPMTFEGTEYNCVILIIE